MKRLALKFAWFLLRKLDPIVHQKITRLLREELAREVERVSPTETPIFSAIETKHTDWSKLEADPL